MFNFKRKKVSARTVRRVLDRLRSGKVRGWEALEKTLSPIYGDMDFGTARLLIEAATEPFAAKIYSGSDTIGYQLLDAAGRDEQEDRIPFIEQNYAKLSANDNIQSRALRLLADIGTAKALESFWKLLKLPESKGVELHVPMVPLKAGSNWRDDAAERAPYIFPAVFDLIGHSNDLPSICDLIVKYSQEGLLDLSNYPDTMAKLNDEAERSLNASLEYDARCKELGLVEPTAEEFDEAFTAEQNLEWVLDVFRHTKFPEAEPLLNRVLAASDLRMKIFAVAAALKQEMQVSSQLLNEIAETPARRATLWQLLEECGLLEHFPESYRTQRLLAEAEMVMWIRHPFEWDAVPEMLELQAIVEVEVEGETNHYYLFTFSHSEFSEGKTCVGIAGPYPKEGPPKIGGRWTFSHFKQLEELSLRQHAATFLDRVEEGIEFEIVPVSTGGNLD
ncbi:hypothetical protein NG895_17975 [Aeoliella sp. ICT_H6.2]|uniref:Uncharacterized protein n=1 Tax=Aeoliella straminimaris TaxID=2954799 RepID=A0A9X2JH83_9BACT|nr:hypothetical protein [Aeoliella straminimaris]MCO6045790.1 hypothetical protein [Aeoliella straminimaris]